VLAPLVFCAFDLGLSSTRLEDAVLDGGEIAYRVAIFICVSFLTQELVSGFTLLITVLLDGRQLAAAPSSSRALSRLWCFSEKHSRQVSVH
jgi:hypothetical protein